jgi:tRNA (guanine-N7-)-methyltransferase
MRIRFKPYARPELASWPGHIDNPMAYKGHWWDAFDDPSLPLRLEYGCGKGSVLGRLALHDTGCNFLGIDIKSEMLVVAKRTIEQIYGENGRSPGNIRLCSFELEHMERLLAPPDHSDRIYINFCNPWHKSGHAKHRLTHPRQLVKMRDILRENGEIWLKTDDDKLFNDSLRYFAYTGFEVVWQTGDLHADEPAWNIRTEHEEMFTRQGAAIKACRAAMRPALLNREEIRRLKNI